MTEWPSVEVVIPTRDRPQLLAEAIAAVRAQDYPGPLRVLVVFDQQEPDHSIASDVSDESAVPVRVTANARRPGLAGARNTGILSSRADYVAFCDDDDAWLAGKLRRQMRRVLDEPGTLFATTAIRVDFGGSRSPRLVGADSVPHARLVDSRMAMLHSSTFLIRREALLGELGLVDEDAPGSHNEDWDLLLRAAAVRAIAHLDEPLVAVRWGSASMFTRDWQARIDSTRWMLAKHPELRGSAVGHARLLGQMAFARAALGQRREAFALCRQAIRTRWREPRAYLAAAVAARVLSPRVVLELAHRRGHGV